MDVITLHLTPAAGPATKNISFLSILTKEVSTYPENVLVFGFPCRISLLPADMACNQYELNGFGPLSKSTLTIQKRRSPGFAPADWFGMFLVLKR